MTLTQTPFNLSVQIASDYHFLPSRYYLKRWVSTVLHYHHQNPGFERSLEKVGILIRIVDEAESAALNQQYRHKVGPTNVLSFPFEPPPGMQSPILGDLVICAPIVANEASQAQKSVLSHWAHITIHGCLHLLRYDHVKEEEAKIMESLEVKLLAQLGYANPY